MINIDLRDPHAVEKVELYFQLKRAGVIIDEEMLLCSAKADTPDTAAALMAESEELDSKAYQICPFWGHSRSEEGINGIIDTFSCKENFCADAMIVRPYSDDVLLSGLMTRCSRANKMSDEHCSLYRANQELARRRNHTHQFNAEPYDFSLKEEHGRE